MSTGLWLGSRRRPSGFRDLMRIDVVTDTFAPDVNGVAMTLGHLTHGLRSRGHKVHVIHTGATAQAGESTARSVPLPGYADVRVGLPKPFELRARWERKRPDVVYVATESMLGKSALKAAKAMGIPVATGFHTNFHQYVDRYAVRGLQPIALAYLKSFHARAQCTITPSPEMVDYLRGVGIEHVALVGRGVETNMFSPAKRCEETRRRWGVGPATPVAIVVGRVAAEKNLELAVTAFAQMRRMVPDMPCVIVGDGPVRASLQQAHPWIHFEGMLTGEDLARCYASADILLFPSETETFGNVLLEGMASGLATVSYDYAASAMHVVAGSNGLKAPKGDAAAFCQMAAQALTVAPEHPLRQAARATAERQGWAQVIDGFEAKLGELAAAADRVHPARMRKLKRPQVSCRTVILSDIHLGTPDSKANEVVRFLKHVKCEKLILNGDIIDGWALRRGGKWTSRHSRVIRKFIKMAEKDGVDVIYTRGNHDDILERFLPLEFGRIKMVKEHVHVAASGKRYLVLHGDGFDSVSTNHQWLALAGAVGYDLLLKLNRMYNKWRAWRGKEYFSFSKAVKAKVKSAVSFVDRYEELLQNLAAQRKCDGIICGHIHTPEDKQVGDVHYLNSGDWVESLTAIVEHHDGRMELVHHQDFLSRLYGNEGAEHRYQRLDPQCGVKLPA